jgi:hypothetical protein
MSKRKRTLRTTIFIACEGRNTEPIYFEKLVEEIEDLGVFAVTIYPDKSDDNPVSHALGLVREARSRIDEFDEVWTVFDRNGYTKPKEAFDEANKLVNGKKVNIAFSSIAFEQWVLLHFIKSDKTFEKSAQIVELLRTSGYFPDYEKKTYIDTYSFLKDKTLQAIENSAWLKHELEKLGSLPANPLYQMNPYTDVDALVMRLLGVLGKWVWGSVAVPIAVGGVELLVQSIAPYQALQVTIINLTGNTLLYNTSNIGAHFVFRAGSVTLPIAINKTTTILAGGQETFTLTTPAAYAGFIFECRIGDNRIMVAL